MKATQEDPKREIRQGEGPPTQVQNPSPPLGERIGTSECISREPVNQKATSDQRPTHLLTEAPYTSTPPDRTPYRLMYVSIRVNDVLVSTMLDTGATNNFMATRILTS
ncbi:unnamed protein product [Citrullus colocynthis]|uniref:Gag-pol polyprotein n=1 Tax=Citrullus colocynthis TaxID=252529 RepID=A0ABP0XYY3_9ROSI